MVDLHEAAVEASAELVRQRGGDACVVQADVTKSGDVQNYVKATLDAHGAIDCFFNNAGIEGKVMPMQDYDEADFDAVIAVNLKGVFLGMRHVLPVMLKQRHGAIVNTSSTAGLFGGPGIAPYVASKHAVLGLTKVASADVARLRVRVNAVCPGLVETRMMRSLEAQINPAHPVAVHDAYSGSIPTGRYATPEEVANVVMYLCSDLANDITGTHIVIDGAARPGPAERCGASNNSSAIPTLVFLIAPAAARPETHNSIFRKTGLIG